MFSTILPTKNKDSNLRIVWIHGWGGSHEGMLPMANYFADEAECVLVDLCGFGRSPEPERVYSSTDYAKDIFDILAPLPKKKTIFVGFSYGGRVALRAALLAPDKVDGLVLLSAAGLVRRRSLAFKIRSFISVKCGALVRRFPSLSFLKKLSRPSRDYKNATPLMRQVLVKSLKEDLKEEVVAITCPTLLIYGEQDTETPPSFGVVYHEQIKDSALKLFKNDTHLSILTSKPALSAVEDFIQERF